MPGQHHRRINMRVQKFKNIIAQGRPAFKRFRPGRKPALAVTAQIKGDDMRARLLAKRL